MFPELGVLEDWAFLILVSMREMAWSLVHYWHQSQMVEFQVATLRIETLGPSGQDLETI